VKRFKKAFGKDAAVAWLLLAPNMLWMLVFTVFAIGYLLWLSLNDVNLFADKLQFVGLANYAQSFADTVFQKSILNTLIYAAVTVAFSMALALLVAVLLNGPIKGRTVMRAAFFLPSVLPIIAICQVWRWLFEPSYGLLNFILEKIGLCSPDNPIMWLGSPDTALLSIILFSIWKGFGYNMVIYLAALQDVPRELYEAAEIDGASSLMRFWGITLPMMRPASFFIFITSFSGAFQTFGEVYALTNGGPVNSTNLVAFYIYQYAFQFFKVGRGAAVSIVLFLLLFAFTIAQWKSYETKQD
jgi:ABC-type sugar transport systems, permease components